MDKYRRAGRAHGVAQARRERAQGAAVVVSAALLVAIPGAFFLPAAWIVPALLASAVALVVTAVIGLSLSAS